MAEFASVGKANAGLTTGIIGTSLSGLLAAGVNPLAMLGGARSGCCESDHMISRYDMGKENEITQLKMEKALLESNIYTDSKIADVYERLNTKIAAEIGGVNFRINGVEAQLAQQAVYNATNTATIGCIQNQVAQLMGLSKLIIPASSVCPEPMPAKNAWVAPTAG
jgi:hypothetical protein